jgi:3-hydroxyisobutyrate dehydrogenase
MVAVIGLGNMGMAMLKRLLEKGHKPSAWDLDPAKRDAAREAGASIGADLKHSIADITILSLPHDAAVAEVLAQILPALPQGAVIIDTSTLSQVAKLVNNLLVASHLVTAGEALRLGAAAGVSPEALLPVLNGASGRSAVTEVNWPRWIIPGSFDSGFSAGLMRKDVGLALELARELDVSLHATGRAAALWQEMRDAVPDAADFNHLSAALFAGAKP